MEHTISYIMLIWICLSVGPIMTAEADLVMASEDVSDIDAYKAGEWFEFRIHYGIFNASYATLELVKDTLQKQEVYHAKGYGRTTGLARWFFKVEDRYESYFDMSDGRPYRFIRKIDEGGYTKDIEVNFDHEQQKAYVNDKKHQKKTTFDVNQDIHDMLSAFYYLRNNYNTKDLVVGDTLEMKLFFDEETFPFRLKYLGKERLKSRFGKIECLKFTPYVQSGRVFKESESLTVWVSNDDNRIPIRIEAGLMIGSIKADLNAFKGLRNPFKIVVD